MKAFLLISLSLIITTLCFSQENLVVNPSFELIEKRPYNYVYIQTICSLFWVDKDVKSIIPVGWFAQGLLSTLLYNSKGKYLNYFPRVFGKIRPINIKTKDGENCVSMYAWNISTTNNTGFIFSKTTKPLNFGKVYKVSAWFYFPNIPHNDSLAYKHTGLTLLRNPINDCFAWDYYKNWRFNLDTFRWDEWYETTWYVRPLCDLNCIVIGTNHTDDWPPKNHESTSFFFVDNLSITEVNPDSVPTNVIVTPFCKSPEWEELDEHSGFNPTVFYFKSQQSDISKEDITELNEISSVMKKNKNLVVEIRGHTDEVNADNQALSEKRAASVLDYLTQKAGISKYRFISSGVANAQPICKNKDESCRSKNRRVEINPSQVLTSQIIYRQVLDKINSSQLDSAFQLIKFWFNLASPENKILVLLDPRVKTLVTNKLYKKAITKLVKNEYNKHKYSSERFFLDSLFWVDQRHKSLEEATYSLDNSEAPDSLFENIDEADDYIRNHKLCLLLEDFINKNGWPDDSKYGSFSGAAAFYVLAHTNDSNLIKKNLALLKEKCLIGESSWRNFSMLSDKLMELRDKPQIYGTQHIIDPENPNYLILYKCVPFEELNKNREKIGLTPISEISYYEKQHLRKKVNKS